ncbi:MAG: ArnT family glycosyltransferase [Cetobacterium sp.]
MIIKDDSYKKKYTLFFISYFIIILGITFLRAPDLRNELKYFLITDQMIENKSFIILKYFNELYPDKPPIYFWILATIRMISKEYFYPLSLIFGSVIPAGVTGFISFKISKLFWNEKMAHLSTAILVTLPYLFGISLVLRMDYLMTMFITLSLYTFFKMYSQKEDVTLKKIFIFYSSIAIGILVKGGAAALIPALTITCYLFLENDLKYLKRLKPFIGLSIILSILGFWFLSILSFENGKEYIALILGQETIGRVVKAKTHTKPIYFYLRNLPLTTMPLAPFFILGIYQVFKNWKTKHEWKQIDKVAFSYFFPSFLFFSLISGKLDIYLLPLYFGIVTLAVRFIEQKWSGNKERICKKIISINIAVLIGCIFALPYYNRNYTMKDSIQILREKSQKIYSYRFNDAKNILSEINSDSIEDIPLDDLNNLYKGDILLARKKYYKDIQLQNFKEIYSNKEYIILKKL